MKLTRLQILRMAKEYAFDNYSKYSDRYINSNCTDAQAKEIADYFREQFEELIDLIGHEQIFENSLMSL